MSDTQNLQKAYDRARIEGKAQVLAGLTYTVIFGSAAYGVAYVGQDAVLGHVGQYFLSAMMIVCAKITNKDIDSLGKQLADMRKDLY